MTDPGRTASAALGAALALTALAPAPGPAFASGDPTAPPPESVTVTLRAGNGTGCPPGTEEFSVDPQSHAFTIKPTRLRARAGGTAEPTARRARCTSLVRITAPPEFTYAIISADHFGLADLKPGASGRLQYQQDFLGNAMVAFSHVINGPAADNWQFGDYVDITRRLYRPCSGSGDAQISLDLIADLGTSDRSQESLMQMDAAKGSTFKLEWKRCRT
ncbi:DUF4360 domain-containing protein [Actinomadura roseirufa]|uniref:DUF4360 domain-containing protein n=1 Tax=Actinomadura roseirufa TaxID=2094049 RepID=UPI0010416133|nr:DUF4360 domain-containing protein [Actinomadura roseirufa]